MSSEKVLDLIGELIVGKKSDFRIRAIENFAYLEGYLMKKKKEYGQKWKVDHKPIKKVAESDPNQKVKSRAKKAYEMISGGELPKEPIKDD